MGEITKKVQKKKVEVVRTCDAKRGTLRRKEGNGNASTGEKREEDLREDGWTK